MTDDGKRPNSHVIEGGGPEVEGWLNETQAILLCMLTDEGRAADARDEITKIVKAWRRGWLLPRGEAPLLSDVLAEFDYLAEPKAADRTGGAGGGASRSTPGSASGLNAKGGWNP
jgi:hypothetical protein